ncbi:MAG: hypothetical protein MR430_10605 [Lachnospiraceae bacterium]|nr:hypothetical protein [Lachnospiraceae bacterium]
MGNISTEQKLQLIQRIRAESQSNRMTMRSRERLLYETGAGQEKELYALEQPMAEIHSRSFSSFRLRLVLSVVLFGGFLILDAGYGELAGISAEELRTEINRDFDTGLEGTFFDFKNSFPYTLF